MAFVRLADQEYYLRQGDLDGACGPYAVIMALLALGIIKRDVLDEYVDERIDGRTRLGKILSFFDRFNANFFNNGTTEENLVDSLNANYRKLVSVGSCEVKSFDDKLKFLKGAIDSGKVIVMMLKWESGAHWVVCVGYKIDGAVTKLFLLDSGENSTKYRYNATLVFERRPGPRVCLHRGRYGQDSRCWIEGTMFSIACDE